MKLHCMIHETLVMYKRKQEILIEKQENVLYSIHSFLDNE